MEACRCARLHARRRAWQRFGLALAAPNLAAIEAFVRAGGVVRAEAEGCQAAELVLRDKLVYVIFEPVLDGDVTVLPKGRAERARRRA